MQFSYENEIEFIATIKKNKTIKNNFHLTFSTTFLYCLFALEYCIILKV